MDIVLTELVQTCYMCPSQWSGKTTDGKEFYARYRWGGWYVSLNGAIVASGNEGNELDGGCSFDEMKMWAAAEGVRIKEAV